MLDYPFVDIAETIGQRRNRSAAGNQGSRFLVIVQGSQSG